ncbi:LysR family transcriptional regulator [Streptomyces sp. AN091965]|uniref:LysR family transcriptional regulator n=1 Tax=Streptomyces sp. AN091965 TaxID=2927803 RepID=UPI001F60C56E|nr:LysR substrate-binding domain-containing protein [Streptomyces sp. AN091965]MCI3929076.1 LysR substrate-binding domain-containing protein [Streptomyces sp. AN091965]
MELRQLRYFLTVVEEANFTRAAARLHVAQPGVSAQVRQLERELGQRLLDRSGRTVTVTEAGAAVLPYARAALAAVEGMRQTADEFTGLLRGRVTIGVVSGSATGVFGVAELLADFHDDHPHVEIALTEDTSERMLAALRAGELDIALVGPTADTPPQGILWDIVVDEPLAAVVAEGDPLIAYAEKHTGHADDDTDTDTDTAPSDAPTCSPSLPPVAVGATRPTIPGLPLTALAERPLISLPRGTGLRAALERACARAGFAPRVAFEAAAPDLVAQLAARGLGVAVFPASEAEVAELGLRALPFAEPVPRGRIALARRADGPQGPAAHAFLTRLQEALMPGAADASTSGAKGRDDKGS